MDDHYGMTYGYIRVAYGWHTSTREWHTDDIRVHTNEYILVHTSMWSVCHSPVVLTMNLPKHASDHLSASLFLKENIETKDYCKFVHMQKIFF